MTRKLLPVLGLLALFAGPAAAVPERVPRASQSYGEGKILKPDFPDLVKRADLILLGRVIRIGGIPHPGPSKGRPRSRRFTFWEDSFAVLEIEQTVKGKAPGATVKVAFHSDLEGDKTNYQAGKRYVAFLLKPNKYPDAYTTAHFHYGEFRINEQGKAERVADPSEMSKPTAVILENIHKAMGPSGKKR